MKSERRHELQKNELADRLASGIESTRSLLPVIGIILAVMLVGAIGWGVYNRYSRGQASAAWTEFYFNLTGGDADSFADLAAEHPRSAAAGWAQQVAGDAYLQRGIAAMYRNRTEAKELIGKAIAAFEKVDQTAGNPELRSKALLGLAQAHESLGDLDQAASYYQQLSKLADQPGLVDEANQRLAFVTSDAGKSFYSWFSQLDPKPDAPITLPSDLSLPPGSPDLEFGPSDFQLNNALDSVLGPGRNAPTEAAATPAATTDTSSAPNLPAAGSVPELQLGDQPASDNASDDSSNAAAPPLPDVTTDGQPEAQPKPQTPPAASSDATPEPEAADELELPTDSQAPAEGSQP